MSRMGDLLDTNSLHNPFLLAKWTSEKKKKGLQSELLEPRPSIHQTFKRPMAYKIRHFGKEAYKLMDSERCFQDLYNGLSYGV